MPDVDFSANASVYDRRHGALLPESAARELTAGLPPGVRVLDIGAGTGRVSVALAMLGFDVTALEPADGMLGALRAKAASLRLRLVRGEGGSLPFPPASFDAVVFSRILYLLSDWRRVLLEAVGALVPGGRLLHEWGNGSPDEEWVQIRDQARELFEAAGVTDPFHPGVREEREVEQFLASQGVRQAAQVSLGAGPPLPLSDFLRKIDEGECSYVWSVPEAIQARCLPALRTWAAARFDLDRPLPFPREVRWTIYRRAGDEVTAGDRVGMI